MNPLIRLVLGALAGWLTGKAADGEYVDHASMPGRVKWLDAIYGIMGATVGDYLFFWVIIDKSSAVANYATAILGAVTVTGLARWIAVRRPPRRFPPST